MSFGLTRSIDRSSCEFSETSGILGLWFFCSEYAGTLPISTWPGNVERALDFQICLGPFPAGRELANPESLFEESVSQSHSKVSMCFVPKTSKLSVLEPSEPLSS